ncbi:5-methylcytosine restriction system specificity protein McrC [Mycolicibacter sinensis]|uniref:5-methylcytosine-specific restriction endonuclease system specificity protein McrC n=1 Tax=Mycolicibacter sinensis (strain JDM601) TaxID=875328 RepID=A0A1A3TYL8_MYCSD|nr:hypothetical protein [Mycolicibacter sinensis]OBK87537.1 hypothetical protein A5648_03395 [Mycolicibacter sinensis]
MLVVGEGATRIPVRSLWLLLVYASGLLQQLRTTEQEAILAGQRDNDLIDAIAEVLVAEVEMRLRRELTFQYRLRHADLTRVRGRIDHLRTSSHRLTDQGRIACRFDELSVNSPRNRFIADTLLFAVPAVISPELAHRCRAAAFRMHRLGVSDRAPSKQELSGDRIGRHDVGDRRMLDAAHLLRRMAIPVHQTGPLNAPRLSNNAGVHRKLFEAAVRGFFRHTLRGQGWRVQSTLLRWTSPGTDTDQSFLPIMKTDITLDHEAKQRRIVIETKFTDALNDHEGKTSIKTDYLYQLYAYLASQSGRGSHRLDTAEGVLLFVKTADRDVFDGEMNVQTHRIRFMSVDLSKPPNSIRTRWMQCIDE